MQSMYVVPKEKRFLYLLQKYRPEFLNFDLIFINDDIHINENHFIRYANNVADIDILIDAALRNFTKKKAAEILTKVLNITILKSYLYELERELWDYMKIPFFDQNFLLYYYNKHFSSLKQDYLQKNIHKCYRFPKFTFQIIKHDSTDETRFKNMLRILHEELITKDFYIAASFFNYTILLILYDRSFTEAQKHEILSFLKRITDTLNKMKIEKRIFYDLTYVDENADREYITKIAPLLRVIKKKYKGAYESIYPTSILSVRSREIKERVIKQRLRKLTRKVLHGRK